MRGVFLIAAAATVWAGSAMAFEQRVSLDGYQDFKFGTPEAEVRARIKVIEESKAFGGIRLKTTETVQIDGEVYKMNFEVKDGTLTEVGLSRSFSASITECETKIFDLAELWQTKYGAPDLPPGIATVEDFFSGAAHFTFNDGGRIMLSGDYGLGDCDLSIDYISGRRNQ